jgi:trk system potassium uptake protein TrkH
VQLLNGNSRAIWKDTQVRGFLLVIFTLTAVTTLVLTSIFPHHWEDAVREGLFNITSIISGTGYASVDYMEWGPFLITMFFFIGLIGGCAGSTACSIKIFRYQLLLASLKVQIRQIYAPSGVFLPRYDGRPISEDVINSVMAYFVMFVVSLGVLTLALSLTGLDLVTSISGAATALANIGPGLGDQIGPSGNFQGLNDVAKWMLCFGMLAGRLELLAVYTLFTARFWRA